MSDKLFFNYYLWLQQNIPIMLSVIRNVVTDNYRVTTVKTSLNHAKNTSCNDTPYDTAIQCYRIVLLKNFLQEKVESPFT